MQKRYKARRPGHPFYAPTVEQDKVGELLMYTCDFCGEDVAMPENLIRANYRDGSGDSFYGCCDVLVCDECIETFSDTVVAIEDQEGDCN